MSDLLERPQVSARPRPAVEQLKPTPRLFTYDELMTMSEAGLFEDADVELIEGVIYEMPSDGQLHNEWTVRLVEWLVENNDGRYRVLPASTVKLSDRNAPKPDFALYPRHLRNRDVHGPEMLLAIKESHTTLRTDLRDKAALYARHGVREYWVIDLVQRLLHVHRGPTADGYTDTPPPFGAEDAVEALLVPGLILRIADLVEPDIGPD